MEELKIMKFEKPLQVQHFQPTEEHHTQSNVNALDIVSLIFLGCLLVILGFAIGLIY